MPEKISVFMRRLFDFANFVFYLHFPVLLFIKTAFFNLKRLLSYQLKEVLRTGD